MKAIFPTGESKKKKSSKPRPRTPLFAFVTVQALPNWGKTAATISEQRQKSRKGGSKEIEGRRGRERGGQRGSIFIFPELGLSLNGRKEELC